MTKILLLVLVLLTFSSCKYSEELDKMDVLAQTRSQILELGDFELNDESQKLLAKYFLIIKDMAYTFDNSSKMQKYFHKRFDKYFKARFCQNSIIEKETYDAIIKKCTYDNFFICSDDILYFEEILKKTVQQLSSDEINKLQLDGSCMAKFRDYSLI